MAYPPKPRNPAPAAPIITDGQPAAPIATAAAPKGAMHTLGSIVCAVFIGYGAWVFLFSPSITPPGAAPAVVAVAADTSTSPSSATDGQPAATSVAATPAVLDFTKPLFTGANTIACNIKADLDNLKDHISAGVPVTLLDLPTYNCLPTGAGDAVYNLGGTGFLSSDIHISYQTADGIYHDGWTVIDSLTN